MERLYLLCGTANFAIALIFTLGNMFSSIGFALAVVALVDIPIVVSLMAFRSGSKIFPALTISSSLLMIAFTIFVSWRNVKQDFLLLSCSGFGLH